MKSLKDTRFELTRQFKFSNIDNPDIITEWILESILGYSKIDLLHHENRMLERDIYSKIISYVNRHINGEPIQYVTGFTDFYSVRILVGDGAFIPRPETEHLVAAALNLYDNKGPILDLCTGSGCIIFAIANKLSTQTVMIGGDISYSALKWANKNLESRKMNHESLNISFVCGNLFDVFQKNKFELITVNPPYIAETDRDLLPDNVVGFDPENALFAANEGLAIIEKLAAYGRDYLIDSGWIICEIGESQGRSVYDLFSQNQWQNIEILQDYNNKDRILVAQNR